jgi:sugar O-acyltransferase (sialic acid O-acetyltransferase NeuD family)
VLIGLTGEAGVQARIIVFGAGGHAKVLLEAIRLVSPGAELAIVDDSGSASSAALLGLPLSGDREWLAGNWPEAAVALGIGNNEARAAIADWLRAQGRSLATVIHPSATVSPSASIGSGAFLAAGAVVNAEAGIGEGVILNTLASVDHDCDIASFAHIAPGSRLCGAVRIGARSLIGAASVVIPGVTVGADAIVGAGSAVLKDVPAGFRVAGSPARPI